MELEEPDNETKELLESKTKKQKKYRTINLRLANKRRRVTEKSDVAKWAPSIIQNDITDLPGIKAFIQTKFGVIPGEDTQKILSLLSKAKVSSGRVILSDNFAEESLYFYINFGRDPRRLFTNDELYLALLYSLLYASGKLKEDFYNEFLDFMGNASIEKVYFGSNIFAIKSPSKSGFYQDFESDFAILGFDPDDETDKKTLEQINMARSFFTFSYKGKDYQAMGTLDKCIICRRGTKQDEIAAYIKKSKVFSTGKKMDLKLKEVKYSKKAYYVNMKLKPEDFCPAFLHTGQDINVFTVFKMKFDLNSLFETMDRIYQKNKGFKFFRNSCYWDNMDTWYDFLSIYALTSKIVSKEDKGVLINYVNLYHNIKPILVYWKEIQLKYQKILHEFYNSFSNTINYDKLKNLKDKIWKYIGDKNELMSGYEYADVYQFVTATKTFSMMINHQFEDKVFQLADAIYYVLQQLTTAGDLGTIIDNLKRIGQSIYFLSYSRSNDPVFPFVVSPGAFLGNLKGGLEGRDPLAELIKDYLERENRIKVTNADRDQIVFDTVKNIDGLRKTVIEANVLNYIAQHGISISSDNLKALYTILYELVVANKEVCDQLDALIIKCKLQNANVKQINFEPDIMHEKIISFIRNLQSNMLANQNEKNNLQILANNILNQVSESNVSGTKLLPSAEDVKKKVITDGDVENEEEINGPKVEDTPKESSSVPQITSGVTSGVTPGNINMANVSGVQTNQSPEFPQLNQGKLPTFGPPENLAMSFMKNMIPQIVNPASAAEAQKNFQDIIRTVQQNSQRTTTVQGTTPGGQGGITPGGEGGTTPATVTITPSPANPPRRSNIVKKNDQIKNQKLKQKQKQPSQLELLYKKYDNDEKEANRLLNKINNINIYDRDNNDTYSSGSFIEKDIKKDKSAKTESLIDEFYNHNKKEEASTFNLAGMVLDRKSINKLANFYVSLANFLNTLGFNFKVNAPNGPYNKMMFLHRNMPFSNQLINSLSYNIKGFPDIKKIKNWLAGLDDKRYVFYNMTKNLTVPETRKSTIRELVSSDMKKWPNYRSPREAREEYIDYSKVGMSIGESEGSGESLDKNDSKYNLMNK